MQQLEQQIVQRFPHWFRGARGLLARPLLKQATRFARLDQAERFLGEHGHLTGFAFVEAALERLGVRYTVDQVERERIPHAGRLLVIANHPAGARDALALLHLIGQVRRDVKIVANDLLCALPGLRELLLPLRIVGGRPGPDSLAAVEQALAAEQCVIVFPAGEVSRLGWRGIADGPWRRGFLRFARLARAPLLPIRVVTRNSAMFYAAAALFPALGTALLPREAFAGDGRLQLRVGVPRRLDAGGDARQQLRAARRSVYALGTRHDDSAAHPAPLPPPVDRAAVLKALAGLDLLGETPDGKRIHCGRLAPDSLLLREIGRLRELSFRDVGEGSGKRLDLDAYDTWYEHIVLWDPQALEIAGAYRIAHGGRVLAERGIAGLYTASLFHYEAALLPRLAAGMELGRSFVAPAYRNSRSLDYLWLGIGAYLRRHPDVRYLFGPVSISAALPAPAREQLVAYYQRYYGSVAGAAARRPFRFLSSPPAFADLDAGTSFDVLKDNLAALGARVPVLYKQYTDLCEPGGARFLAFGVDPDFSDAVDGLIEVDLQRIRPRKRSRYLGEATPVLAADAA